MTNHQTPTQDAGGDHPVKEENIMTPETGTSYQLESFEDIFGSFEDIFGVSDIEAAWYHNDNFDMSSGSLASRPETEMSDHSGPLNILAPQQVATGVRFRDSAPAQSTDQMITGRNRWTNKSPMFSIPSHVDNGVTNGRKPLNSRNGVNKRNAWTKEEHGLFLRGLQLYGRGDWMNISKNMVPKRTPSQVASHAQKYFLRLQATEEMKKRRSIHDITDVDDSVDAQQRTPTNTFNAAQQVQGLQHTSVSGAQQVHDQLLEQQGISTVHTLTAQQVPGLAHTFVSRAPSHSYVQVLEQLQGIFRNNLLLTQQLQQLLQQMHQQNQEAISTITQQLINKGDLSHALDMMHNQGAPGQMPLQIAQGLLNNEGAPYIPAASPKSSEPTG